MADVLTFNEEMHEYRLGDRVLPSVTTILKPMSVYELVPPNILEAAREFGTHVHKMVELEILGLLDEGSLDPALAPYLTGWRKFLRDSGYRVVASEMRLHHPRLGFAGTLDLLLERKYRRCQMDIKSGIVPRTVGPQTAAYDQLLMAGPNKGRSLPRFCLQLKPGDYEVTALTNPADWPNFLSCLNLWKFHNAK